MFMRKLTEEKLRSMDIDDAADALYNNDLEPLLNKLPKRDKHIYNETLEHNKELRECMASFLLVSQLMGDYQRTLVMLVCGTTKPEINHSELMSLWENQIHRKSLFSVKKRGIKFKFPKDEDLIRMAWSRCHKYDFFWSRSKKKEKHDQYQKIVTREKIRKENTPFDVDWLKKILPDDLQGRVIDSSRRLSLEGMRQGHCVASYDYKIKDKRSGILSMIVDGKRWTVEVDTSGYPVQIKAKHNESPSKETRTAIHKRLNVKGRPRNYGLTRADSNLRMAEYQIRQQMRAFELEQELRLRAGLGRDDVHQQRHSELRSLERQARAQPCDFPRIKEEL